MSSQEEYLDQLLNNIMNGGKEPPQKDTEESAVVSQAVKEINTARTIGENRGAPWEEQIVPDLYGMPEMPGISNMSGMPETSGISNMSGMPETSGISNMSGMPETPGVSDMSGITDMTGMSDLTGAFQTPDYDEAQILSGDGVETPDLYGMPEMPGISGMPGMPELSGITDMTGMPEMPDVAGISEGPDDTEQAQGTFGGAAGMPDITGMPESFEIPGVSEETGMSEDNSDILGIPADDSDIEDFLNRFGDTMSMSDDDAGETDTSAGGAAVGFSDILPEENASGSPETVDLSSMSEDDIDRLLAESRRTSESHTGGQEEAFQGDVVDMLEGTQDSELQEIQNLLEKSDHNEAVGDEVETLLREAVQDNYQNSTGGYRAGVNAELTDGAEEELSPKQRKAMEKKRLKEEKAAAKKAAKEARKAEKAARKAAKKGESSVQNAENAPGAASGAADAEAGEPIDTAFLDSILSEAGKIDGAETVSSATGNYDAKVDDIIPEESENASPAQNTASGAVSAANDGLGIDLDNLFGDSAKAESALMAGGGTSDQPDFVPLDGDDVTGIMELAGEEEEEESKPRKKGFFSRFLEFLTEEEEEEEENEDIKLSDENKEILEDLDKEKNKKDKKGKKGKKKAKKADASAEGGEEEEEGGGDKKGRKKKARKPKKEKLPREEEPVDPGKKLSLKKVLPILLICLSLGASIIIITFASVNFTDKKAARDAYYDGDYQTCYQNLYGKDRNENEQIMYARSESILTIRMWIREYEMLEAEGARLEALDSLIQSVNDYPVLYDYAAQWNAEGEVAQEYATILNLLYENYGLTEDQARAIAAEPDDIEYTRQVNIIVQGGAYGSWIEPEPVVEVPLQDELPEEAELPESNFIDTNTSVQ